MNKQNNQNIQGRTGTRTDQQILEKHTGVQEKVRGYMKRGKLRRIIAILSAFVLLFTLNSLKFKADTLQRIATCGLEEHTHTEACYNEAGELVCGRTEHEHTDACYQQRPVQPEPTVFDEFKDLNSQVVLASPMEEDVSVSSDSVDETVGETTMDLDADSADEGIDAEAVTDEGGLEVEYDLDDLYGEDGDEATIVDDYVENDAADAGNDADQTVAEYSLNGGSVAFLSDVLRATGLEVSGITAVGEIADDAFVDTHIAVEPVEGVDGEYVLKVTESFDRVQLGVATADAIETVWLTDGQAVAAVYDEAQTSDETVVAEEAAEPAEPAEEIVEQTEETFNSNETIETEQKQTEVGDIETEVGMDADVSGDQDASSDEENRVEAEAAPIENDESVTEDAADASDVQGVEDAAGDNAVAENEDAADAAVGEDASSVEDEQAGEDAADATVGEDASSDEDEQAGEDAADATVGEDASSDEDEQAGEDAADAAVGEDASSVEDEQVGEDAADAAVGEDASSVEDEQAGEDAADEQAGEDGMIEDGQAAGDEQAAEDEQAAVVADRKVSLDFTNYIVDDAHTVYLYDAEMRAVLVNTAEIETVDGVVVTTAEEEAANEAADEAAEDESGEESEETGADEGGVLIIEGDGEYALNGTAYVVTGLVLPEAVVEEAQGAEQSGEEIQDAEAPAEEAQADEETAVEDQSADDAQDEAAPAEKTVALDFTDYIATDDHAVFLYDASMVAVLVNEAEIASADGVTVTLPEEAAEETDEALADAEEDAEAPAEEAADDAQAGEGTLIITGDGEYALNGTTYVVTGLVLPEKTVENDNITITTANDEATLLNVAPVFEETDEDYDDIFSLFTMAKDDPTLLARVMDILGGVAYAEEDEDGEAERDLNVKVFRIGLEDVTTGEAVEPGTELHVETSLDAPVEGEEFQLYHIENGKAELIPDAVVVEDGQAVGLNFNTVSLDKFALVYYTVNVVVEEKNITIDVDFTDVVENGVDFDSQDILTALNDGVAIDVASLLAGETGDSLIVEASATADVDVENLEATAAEGGVTYADGAIKVTGDGAITLTDSVYTIIINVTNYQTLVEKELKADGVTVEVIDGEVPAGSTVTYEALSDAHTEALVEEYIPEAVPASAEAEPAPAEAKAAASGEEEADSASAEETVEEPQEAAEEAAEAPSDATDESVEEKSEEKIETATGYTAFDVSIAMPEGDEFTKEGQFAVTVDHAVDAASLVPEGAVIDNITYELFHIHNGEATQIEDVAVADGQVSFTTDGFSEYVIRYTVEFHNGDNEVVIQGGSQVLLSTLIAELGLTRENGEFFTVDEVESVRFVNPELFTVEEVTESPVTVNGEAVELTTAHDFLITSINAFDASQMTLTFKGEEPLETESVNINGNTIHSVTIKVFDSTAVIHKDPDTGKVLKTSGELSRPDPSFEDNYYLLATFERTIYEGGEPKNTTYWAVNKVDLKDMGDDSSITTEFCDGFKSTDPKDNDTYPISVNDTMNFRLYRTASSPATEDISCAWSGADNKYVPTATGVTFTDQPESAYEYGGSDDAGTNHEIHLKIKDNDYKYKIRLRFNSETKGGITGQNNTGGQTSRYYYVFAKVTHNSTLEKEERGETPTPQDYSYAYDIIEIPDVTALAMDEDGYYYYDYKFDNWKSNDGNEKTDKFTSHEPRIDVNIVQSIKPLDGDGNKFVPDELMQGRDGTIAFKEAEEVLGMKVSYDTRTTRGDRTYKREVEGGATWCYDQITLTSKNVTADYDYAAILGPNIEYGIVAEHLFQGNHLQTNFAVNHFSAHGADVRPDLSGEKPGNIVIAQFNVVDGDRRNAVGNVAYDEVWGRLKIGKPLNGTLMVYVDQDSGYPGPGGSVYDNPDDTIIVPSNGPSLSENIVEPGIEYMKRISAELLSKPITLSPAITEGQTEITIDTTRFDDNATIYLNGDALEKFIETPGSMNIVKKDGQVIVFNFFKKTNDELNIEQFKINGQKTESPEATGTHQNTWMDDVARHIVWNLAGRIRQVNIDTAGGIFLQPNDDSNIDIQGTTAGWIVSDGYVYNSTAEWHNVYEEMPDSVKVNLFAVKYLDKKVPSNDVKFKFKLEKLTWSLGGDNSNHWRTYASNPWTVLQEEANNANQQVSFRTVEHSELDLGWNIFRITETKGDGNYIYDDHVFYAAVLMEKLDEKTARLHNIEYRVSRPQYYSSFDPNAFFPLTNGSPEYYNTLLTGVSGRVAYPEYNNETITTGLTLMKKVDGTDATNKQFTFTVELWTEEPAGIKHALTGDQRALLTHAGVANADWRVDDNVNNVTVVTVKLRNGRKVTIGGLTKDIHYHVAETAIGETDITEYPQTVDHYTTVGVDSNDDGVYEYSIGGIIEDATDAVSVVYNNKYTSAGQKDFTVHKTMVNKDNDETMSLVAGQFKFTLSGDGKTLVGYNDADGNVVFGELDDNDPLTNNNSLSFTQEDMAGAKRNNQGYLEREITYVITESEPNPHPSGLPENFDYNKVIYDGEKTITLVLTDKGNGIITVTPKDGDTALSVQFDNEYMEKATATLEGKKTLEGRELNKAEFLFDARLIKVDEYNVSAETIATANADQATILRNKRQQADPIDVIGHNLENHTPDEENGTTYTGNITFPTIYYTAAGTYVYKITENTTNMPVGVTQKEGTTMTYYAKVVVTNPLSTKPSVSYYTDEACTASIAEAVFTNEAKNINFSVTKEVHNAAGEKVTNCTGRTITFEVYKDGYPIAVDSGMLNVETGVEIVDGGKVKLTGTTTGWPTAQFYNMVPGRYTVKETEWTGFSSGTPSITYEMTVNGETTSSAIRQSGSVMKIINTETDDEYARIKVEKEWEDSDHNTLSDIAGSVQFTLQTVKTIGASGGTGKEIKAVKVKGIGQDGTIYNEQTVGHKITVGQIVVIQLKTTIGNDLNQFNNWLKAAATPSYGILSDNNINGDVSYAKVPASAPETVNTSGVVVDVRIEVPIEEKKAQNDKDSDSLQISLQFDGSTFVSGSAIVTIENAGDPVVVRSSRTITLSAANGWKWDGGYLPISTNGGSTTYKYRIKEDQPEDVESVEYNPSSSAPEDQGWSGWITEGDLNGTFTMTNTVENPKGALKITKLVWYNSVTTTGTEVDGDYIFKVVGPTGGTTVTKYVRITVVNGRASSYKVALANTDEAWNAATSERGSNAIVGELVPGSYVVEEIAPDNGSSLVSAARGDEIASAVDTNKKVTVVVSANDTTAVNNNAQAVFTNNKNGINITATKQWVDGNGVNLPLEGVTSVTFELHKKKQDASTDETGYPITGTVDGVEDGSNGTGELTPWTYTWGKLESKYYDEDEQQWLNYVYSTVETGFTYKGVTYTIDANGAVTSTQTENRNYHPYWKCTATSDGNNAVFTNALNEKDVEFGKQWRGQSLEAYKPWVTMAGNENVKIYIRLFRRRAKLASDSNVSTDLVTEEMTGSGGIALDPDTTSITIGDKTYAVAWENGTEIDHYVYKFTIKGLERYYQGNTSAEWTYYIQEVEPGAINGVTYAVSYSEQGHSSYAEEKGSGETQYIINAENPSYELPSTGGPGTSMFYVFGSIITLLAAVLLITKRRSGSAE